MSKVFGIGLARTGNASLCKALSILGYNCIHLPRTVAEIEYHSAAVDTTCAVGYKFLDLMYPGSKFILTVRDVGPWLGSCRNYWQKHHQNQEEIIQKVHRVLYDDIQFDPHKFSEAKQRHEYDVMDHFYSRPDLLVMDIGNGHGWGRLCPFLGKPIPDTAFPHEHKEDYAK